MHEILNSLPADARVLDLGCRDGSFSREAYPFLTVRVDLLRPARVGLFVQADAVRLPFASGAFDAVVLNHSVEHFVQLKPALQEIGRVLKRDSAAFVAVPDARTLSDRLYRKVIRNRGGHVNLFDSAENLQTTLSWYFGLAHIATRTLYSSYSFLNRRNTEDPLTRGHMRFAGFPEPVLAWFVRLSRAWDRWFGTRTRVYGWAFYFGRIGEKVDTDPLPNVCLRCGQAHPASVLQASGGSYRCRDCGAVNPFFRD